MKIAVTGHRPNKLGGEYNLDGPYSNHIRHELQEIITMMKPTLMISGMALGVDTIWALLAKENNIPLLAAIPFPSQYIKWSAESKALYKELLDYADVRTTSTDPYEVWKMDHRNKYMVDMCDLLVAVYNGDKSGGTYNCLTYAESKNKSIVKIDPTPKNQEYYEGVSESDKRYIEHLERLWDKPAKDEYYASLSNSRSSEGITPDGNSNQ